MFSALGKAVSIAWLRPLMQMSGNERMQAVKSMARGRQAAGQYAGWKSFQATFPLIALFVEHAAAAFVIVLTLELIRHLLLWFGVPTAWNYIDIGDVFTGGDCLIVISLVLHTCYKIWRS